VAAGTESGAGVKTCPVITDAKCSFFLYTLCRGGESHAHE